jgi:hypothetical protein
MDARVLAVHLGLKNTLEFSLQFLKIECNISAGESYDKKEILFSLKCPLSKEIINSRLIMVLIMFI